MKYFSVMCDNSILEYFQRNVKWITEYFLILGGDILIYEKIKKICKERKIAVSTVEKEAGLSNGTICKWNKSSPTVDKLQAVAKVINVKVDDLLSS